jgi:acetate kinase
MKILVLNCGSSSLKYQLIDMETVSVLAKGNYERIGEAEAFLTHKVGGEKVVINQGVKTHDEALKQIISCLLDPQFSTISSLDEIFGVGHRVAHGGEIFKDATLIDNKVIEDIEKLAVFAPLHNPASVMGIKACKELMPNTPMVAVFDTSFHQTMPKESYMYPIPKEYYEKYGIRKYGFHGTSHKYVANRLAELLNKPIEELKIVTCHLGQGASIAAIKEGKSVNTSMGLTPLGGIGMCARSGDLDPSVVTFLMDTLKVSTEEINTILNKQSGVLGISGVSSDFRDVEAAKDEGNERAILAINMHNRTVAEYIARYMVSLQGLDVIVFTAGIGENDADVREAVASDMEYLGIKLDFAKNRNVSSLDAPWDISTEDSAVRIFVIPTNEELVIARDTKELVASL